MKSNNTISKPKVTTAFDNVEFCPVCHFLHNGPCQVTEEEKFASQFTEWRGNSDGTVGLD